MNTLKAYKAIISYDGTEYKGWQSQKNKHGIVDILKKSIHSCFCLPVDTIEIVGASRTDAGVHAHNQVARIMLPAIQDEKRLCKVINDHLPSDIHIRSLISCDQFFNPRHNVLSKTYYYYITFIRPLPLQSRYIYYYPYPLDLLIFEEALKYFVGTHDFQSFATKCTDRITVKTIDECRVERINDDIHTIRVCIVGHSFLHHMVRRMVGAALTLASQNKEPNTITKILLLKNARQPLLNAPAKGLILWDIHYKEKQY